MTRQEIQEVEAIADGSIDQSSTPLVTVAEERADLVELIEMMDEVRKEVDDNVNIINIK